MCVGYRLNGKDVDYFPSSTSELAKVEVVYERVEGWETITEEVRSLDKLPPNACKYIRMIEDYLNIPGICVLHLNLMLISLVLVMSDVSRFMYNLCTSIFVNK